jgi:hypothetical protein
MISLNQLNTKNKQKSMAIIMLFVRSHWENNNKYGKNEIFMVGFSYAWTRKVRSERFIFGINEKWKEAIFILHTKVRSEKRKRWKEEIFTNLIFDFWKKKRWTKPWLLKAKWKDEAWLLVVEMESEVSTSTVTFVLSISLVYLIIFFLFCFCFIHELWSQNHILTKKE